MDNHENAKHDENSEKIMKEKSFAVMRMMKMMKTMENDAEQL